MCLSLFGITIASFSLFPLHYKIKLLSVEYATLIRYVVMPALTLSVVAHFMDISHCDHLSHRPIAINLVFTARTICNVRMIG